MTSSPVDEGWPSQTTITSAVGDPAEAGAWVRWQDGQGASATLALQSLDDATTTSVWSVLKAQGSSPQALLFALQCIGEHLSKPTNFRRFARIQAVVETPIARVGLACAEGGACSELFAAASDLPHSHARIRAVERGELPPLLTVMTGATCSLTSVAPEWFGIPPLGIGAHSIAYPRPRADFHPPGRATINFDNTTAILFARAARAHWTQRSGAIADTLSYAEKHTALERLASDMPTLPFLSVEPFCATQPRYVLSTALKDEPLQDALVDVLSDNINAIESLRASLAKAVTTWPWRRCVPQDAEVALYRERETGTLRWVIVDPGNIHCAKAPRDPNKRWGLLRWTPEGASRELLKRQLERLDRIFWYAAASVTS